MSRFSYSLAFALVSAVGCTAAPPTSPTTASDQQSIIGGSADTTDSAIVLLASYPPSMATLDTCTAVLISPTVLLTAAHCVDTANHPSYTFGIFPGQDASQYDGQIAELSPHLLAVASEHPNPSYNPNAPYTADIAVIVLAAPLDGVTPLAFRTTTPDSTVIGASARIVGYGQTTPGTANYTRNGATTTVTALDSGADTLTVGDSTHLSCLGDSGGPALVNNVIVGIDSYSDTSSCTDPAHYRRTDTYASYIQGFLPASANDAGAGDHDAGTGGGGGGGCDAGGGAGGNSGVLLALGLGLGLLARRRS